MKHFSRCLPLLLPLLFCIHVADAQSAFDINIGGGAAQDKSLGQIDLNTLNGCLPGSTACGNTSNLSGAMLGFGGNLMLWKHFGVGAEVKVQPGRQDYATLQTVASTGSYAEVLQSRVTFFDFDGIVQPVSTKKAALQLQGGIGGANVKFYDKVSSSSSVLGNQNSSQLLGSANHFQVHGGVGVQIYVTDHIFIRPQFDVHFVNNFTQFGRNLVTSEMVWVGYSWGDR